MNQEERMNLNEYFENRLTYLQNDVTYWQDEFRKYPFPSIAQSLSLALLRLQVFQEIRSNILTILEL